jgi:hypothetical protein
MGVPLTQDTLKRRLRYWPETGIFTRQHYAGSAKFGDPAAKVHTDGYLRICVLGNRYYAHRLVWLYVYGCWPTHQIDHINGDRADNRLQNLREIAGAVNMQNQRKAHKGSSTGLLGVTARRGKFVAQIQHNGVNRSLGTYSTAEEAHAVYLAEKRATHPGCTL